MRIVDQDSHERKIPQHGDQAIRKMKPDKLGEQCGVAATVAPCVAQMPCEVVQQRQFDGGRRSKKVVARPEPAEEGERGRLKGHAHGADQVELAPADQRVRGSGSWR